MSLVWTQSDYQTEVSFFDRQGTVTGNAAGMTTRAQRLLTLAAPDVPDGNHWQFEPGMELEDESLPLILSRQSLT